MNLQNTSNSIYGKSSSTEQNVYTTDDRVEHFSKGKEINEILAEIIGQKFIDYRKK